MPVLAGHQAVIGTNRIVLLSASRESQPATRMIASISICRLHDVIIRRIVAHTHDAGDDSHATEPLDHCRRWVLGRRARRVGGYWRDDVRGKHLRSAGFPGAWQRWKSSDRNPNIRWLIVGDGRMAKYCASVSFLEEPLKRMRRLELKMQRAARLLRCLPRCFGWERPWWESRDDFPPCATRSNSTFRRRAARAGRLP